MADLSDDDLLAVLQDEAARAMGYATDSELASNRESSLLYLKGEVDVASLPNRSSAVDMTFSEAVDTVMPDLMEIFTAGDDVAAFRPRGEEDEEAAQQETDYLNHVVFNENDGWRVLYSHIFDALTAKIGVVKVWGEEDEEVEEERFEGQTQDAVAIASETGEIDDLMAGEPDPITGEPLWSFTLRITKPVGRGCIMAVAPEDFTISRDAVRVVDATYAAMRSRPRAQDLIADGYDPDLVAQLEPYSGQGDDATRQARDQAGENDSAYQSAANSFNLHQVEVVEHYIRIAPEIGGKPQVVCAVTNGDASVLLKREVVSRIPFAVSTPFIMAHRLFGMSLFDKLREVQRIKTVLLRTMLDSAYFALNQRYEVAEGVGRASANTLNDLLNNVPGAPVRSTDGSSVRPLGGARLDFDVQGAMEYMATVGEQRSGVVRNAQGLNPDTLHDTAKGMTALMGAAQKRVRMIARVLAETGIKDMYLLMHDVIRTTAKASARVRLRGNWTEIDPSKWGARNDMTIEVGVGSGGREAELAALNMVASAQEKLLSMPNGRQFVSPANLYNTAKKLVDRAGLKSVELYFTDPSTVAPQEPQPDPVMMKAQLDAEVAKYKADLDAEIRREQMAGEFELERERMAMDAQTRLVTSAVGSMGRRVELGGDPG